MRTDHRSERGTATGTPLSRRTFLLVGGSVVGTGVNGTASGSTGKLRQSVEVAATDPYFPTVRSVVEADNGMAVDLRHPDAFDDAADVVVSGRPTESDGVVRDVTIDGCAALAYSDSEWRECLSRSDIADRWERDTSVETWSETDWESVDRANPNSVTPADGRADAAPSVLVRGTRAYQYAQGHGGEGYYSVDGDAVEEVSAGLDAGAYTPLVRLAHIHVDREARSDKRVTAFLRHFSHHTRGAESPVTHFLDPTVTRRGGSEGPVSR